MSVVAFWQVEDLMSALGVSKRTVHRWTGERTVPCRRIGGTRRIIFVPAEIAQWVEAGGRLDLETLDDEATGALIVRPRGAS